MPNYNGPRNKYGNPIIGGRGGVPLALTASDWQAANGGSLSPQYAMGRLPGPLKPLTPPEMHGDAPRPWTPTPWTPSSPAQRYDGAGNLWEQDGPLHGHMLPNGSPPSFDNPVTRSVSGGSSLDVGNRNLNPSATPPNAVSSHYDGSFFGANGQSHIQYPDATGKMVPFENPSYTSPSQASSSGGLPPIGSFMGDKSQPQLPGQPIDTDAPSQQFANYAAGGGTFMPGQIAIVGDDPSGRPTGHEEGIIAHPGGGVTVIPHGQLPPLTSRLPHFGLGTDDANSVAQGLSFDASTWNQPQSQAMPLPALPQAQWSTLTEPKNPNAPVDGAPPPSPTTYVPQQDRANPMNLLNPSGIAQATVIDRKTNQPITQEQRKEELDKFGNFDPARFNVVAPVAVQGKGLPGQPDFLPPGYTPSPLWGGNETPVNTTLTPRGTNAAWAQTLAQHEMEVNARQNPEWAWQQEQARQQQAANNYYENQKFNWTAAHTLNKDAANLQEKVNHNQDVIGQRNTHDANVLLGKDRADQLKQAAKAHDENAALQGEQARMDYHVQNGIATPEQREFAAKGLFSAKTLKAINDDNQKRFEAGHPTPPSFTTDPETGRRFVQGPHIQRSDPLQPVGAAKPMNPIDEMSKHAHLLDTFQKLQAAAETAKPGSGEQYAPDIAYHAQAMRNLRPIQPVDITMNRNSGESIPQIHTQEDYDKHPGGDYIDSKGNHAFKPFPK